VEPDLAWLAPAAPGFAALLAADGAGLRAVVMAARLAAGLTALFATGLGGVLAGETEGLAVAGGVVFLA